MRVIGTAILMTSALAVAPAPAQALPDTTACPESIAAIATCYAAKQESGAYLLAAMPKNWNGNLIVFAHGGPAVGVGAEEEADQRRIEGDGGERADRHPDRSGGPVGRDHRDPGGKVAQHPPELGGVDRGVGWLLVAHQACPLARLAGRA